MNEKNIKRNGWLYRGWAKFLVILLALCTLVVSGLGGLQMARCRAILDPEEAWEGIPYQVSRREVASMTGHVLDEVSRKLNVAQILSDGVFDGNRKVDIMNLSEKDESRMNPATTYSLKKLLRLFYSEERDQIQQAIDEVDSEDIYYSDKSLMSRLASEYGIETFFRDEVGQLYGITDSGITGLKTTRDILQYYLDDADKETIDRYTGPCEILYTIEQSGRCTPFWFGKDADVKLIYTSRLEALARMLDTSELKKKEDITQFYGVYGEQFCYLYETCRNLETVIPESGRKLAVYALLNPYNFSIRDAYEALITATGKVANAYTNAEEIVGNEENQSLTIKAEVAQSDFLEDEEEAAPDTYFYYYYNPATEETISNHSSWRRLGDKEVCRSIQNDPSYQGLPFYYMKANSDRIVQLCQVPDQLSQNARNHLEDFMANATSTLSEQFSMVIVQNPAVQILPDTYLVEGDVKLSAGELSRMFKSGIVMLFCGLFFYLAFMILAMVQAGKRAGEMNRDEAGRPVRHGSAFARGCPVCILAGLYAGAWTGLVLLIDLLGSTIYSSVIGGHFSVEEDMLIMAGLVILAGGLLLWCVLTLAVKIKTRSFWRNSILVGIWSFMARIISRFYLNRNALGKLLLLYGAATVLGLIGFSMALDGEGTGLLLMLIAWAGVLYFLLKKAVQKKLIKDSIEEIAGGNLDYQIDEKKLSGDELDMARNLNNVRGGMQNVLNEQMKSERMKTDLITNVSHDIKTPLTSIINYVDLLKREQIQDERINGYIEILDAKSARLKQLTEDLVEASKISSGNITLNCVNLDLKQLVLQTNGEFLEKFEARQLDLVCDLPEDSMTIYGDGRRIFRILENLYNNAAKYSLPGSRIYVNGSVSYDQVELSVKNISEQPLNFSAEELMERFVRGDVSRSTEGSGLGLEIARNLTVMQNGQFDLYVDGDLFKVTITWKRA